MFFMCRMSERWRSVTCLSEMSSEILVKNLCSYFYCENYQKCPYKILDKRCGTFWNFIQGTKSASFNIGYVELCDIAT